jgi:valyl-tRNA synthetase
MRGKQVFYPIGWDDNGLPTERRVQNYYGVRCDPSLPYDPGFVPPARRPPGSRPPEGPPAVPVPVSRGNFVELCQALTGLDEQAFEEVWRRLGLSVDWSTAYQTIGEDSRAISQRAFLRNLARGEAYLAEAPTLWDVTFQTAVAQAEVEDREAAGAYYKIRFHRPGGNSTVVATTRPELLPACVALVAHPRDARYAGLVGSPVTTPLFGVEVPVLAHHLADPAKGTGIAMACTFGDSTDVIWWRDLHLPARPVMGRDGRLAAAPPDAITAAAGRAAYQRLAGATAAGARDRIAGMLRGSGDLVTDPEPVRHAVNFYEKGSQPLEIVTSRQWYVRNGADDPSLRDELLALGRQIDWHPPYMRARYENWVNGLAGDWLVSRQRFFGVPIPVWYPLDRDGRPRHGAPIVPDDSSLPVDPAAESPPGYREEQRGQPGGFTGDPDVMDSWATSSLTPQIAARWSRAGDLSARVLPMDLRPQAHEIIRTWLFYTLLRWHLERGVPGGRPPAATVRGGPGGRPPAATVRGVPGGRPPAATVRRELPWRHAAISGWVLDPDRKKMSKSVGNVVTPGDALRQHGSDAVRYWAASGRLGTDITFDPGQLRVGRRLAMKILNASRFVLALPPPGAVAADNPSGAITQPLDAAMLARLTGVIGQCTAALENYDHADALAGAEAFFWLFCDDYLELVKDRGYGERGEAAAGSARAALRLALSVLLRLFAPFLPYVTEEVWSWWQKGSVHRAAWPSPAETGEAAARAQAAGLDGPDVLGMASEAIAAIRGAKSGAGLSLRAPVRELVVAGTGRQLDAVTAVLPDVVAAGRVERTKLRSRDLPRLCYEVVL